MSRYTEAKIAEKALVVIASNPGIRTSKLIQELRQIMKPSGKDCEILSGRSGDKFSQKVRNLKSHNSLSDCVQTIDDGDKQNGRKWYTKPYYVRILSNLCYAIRYYPLWRLCRDS